MLDLHLFWHISITITLEELLYHYVVSHLLMKELILRFIEYGLHIHLARE
jgi:hypothetical protein